MTAAAFAPVDQLSLGQARALVSIQREREAAMLQVLKRWQAHFPYGASRIVPMPDGLDVTLAKTDAILRSANK